MVTPAQIRRRKKAAKAFCKAHGIPVPRRLNMTGIAGVWYREMIRRIQHYAWPKLPTTGIADSRVLALLFPPKPETIGHHALRVAESVVGVKEHPPGSNSGEIVHEFQSATGAYNLPWCASFVTWALDHAGWKRKGWNQAYVPAWVAEAHAGANGLMVIGWRDVVAGDIPTFDWGHDGIADHIGIAAGPVDPKTFEFPTVEGNTSVGNDSNGGEVMARVRNLSDVCVFIRVS